MLFACEYYVFSPACSHCLPRSPSTGLCLERVGVLTPQYLPPSRKLRGHFPLVPILKEEDGEGLSPKVVPRETVSKHHLQMMSLMGVGHLTTWAVSACINQEELLPM